MGICGVKNDDGSICQEKTVWNDLCEEHNREWEDQMFGLPTKSDKIKAVVSILDNSDIVWTKYGSDTKEALAERIMKRLEDM